MAYHYKMAVQNGGGRKGQNTGNRPQAGQQAKPGKKPSAGSQGNLKGKDERERRPTPVFFWVLMLVAGVIVFLMLLPAVREKEDSAPNQPPAVQPVTQNPPAVLPVPPPAVQNPPVKPPENPPSLPPEVEQNNVPPPVEETPPVTEVPPSQPETVTEKKPPPSPPERNNTPAASVPPQRPETAVRERNIYLVKPESGGGLVVTKVKRNFAVSGTPLWDSINALLAGPSPEEAKAGMINCMPSGSRIISAEIRGSTAYLNFNEEFQYNILGREGCVAQVRLVVWTATEFPNIKDVQILIEGKRLDFLTEGVEIGSPLGRSL